MVPSPKNSQGFDRVLQWNGISRLLVEFSEEGPLEPPPIHTDGCSDRKARRPAAGPADLNRRDAPIRKKPVGVSHGLASDIDGTPRQHGPVLVELASRRQGDHGIGAQRIGEPEHGKPGRKEVALLRLNFVCTPLRLTGEGHRRC